VSVFRTPSNNSNGNTFDFQGRQLSCEHLTRRVVRYELDGSATIIASMFNGKRLNSPNDAVPHQVQEALRGEHGGSGLELRHFRAPRVSDQVKMS